jgi:hypothetical protein
MKIGFIQDILAVVILGIAISRGTLLGQQGNSISTDPTETLKEFLRRYLNSGQLAPDRTTQIRAVSLKTKGKVTEEIVYISGQRWCGSGGCTLLILEPTAPSFKVLGRVTIVQLPIRVLPSLEHGHPDIGVRIHGGGIQTGYESVLSFDGRAYPKNPSLAPARHLPETRGKEIITEKSHSVPLYD